MRVRVRMRRWRRKLSRTTGMPPWTSTSMLAPYVRSSTSVVRTSPRHAVADHAAVQADDARQVRGDPVEVVRREDDRQPAGVEVVEQVQDLVAQAHVDARRRLVHEQQLGLAEQRARDEHALLLAARQLADVAIGEIADVELREHRGDLRALGAAGPRQPPAVDARHQHALAHRHREAPVDRLDLRHVRHPQIGAPRHAAVRDAHAARQHAQRRRLAGAGGADDADELAPVDREVDVDEDRLAAVAARDARQPEQLLAVGGGRAHCG